MRGNHPNEGTREFRFSLPGSEKYALFQFEPFYGLKGILSLLAREISELGKGIAANNLPSSAFERARSMIGDLTPCGTEENVLMSDVPPDASRRAWLRRYHAGRLRRTRMKLRTSSSNGRRVFTLHNCAGGRKNRVLSVEISGRKPTQVEYFEKALQGVSSLFPKHGRRMLSLVPAWAPIVASSGKGCAWKGTIEGLAVPMARQCSCGRTWGTHSESQPTRWKKSAQLAEWPRISMVVPSFNQARYIRACLDSLLEQRYPNLELIVIDGVSTDGTVEILEEYRSRVSRLVVEPDRSQSHALNKGFALSTGDILGWLCSDDLLENGALHKIAVAFAENRVDVVAGGCRRVNADGLPIQTHHNALPVAKPTRMSFGDMASFTATWQRGLYFYQPEVFFSRDIWDRSGAVILEHLHWVMDYDLYLRFGMAGATILHIPEIIGVSRSHDAQKTRLGETPDYLPTVRALIADYRDLILKACAISLQGAGAGEQAYAV